MPTREEKIRKILIKFTKELKKGNMGVSDLIRMIMDWHESELAKQREEILGKIEIIYKEKYALSETFSSAELKTLSPQRSFANGFESCINHLKELLQPKGGDK